MQRAVSPLCRLWPIRADEGASSKSRRSISRMKSPLGRGAHARAEICGSLPDCSARHARTTVKNVFTQRRSNHDALIAVLIAVAGVAGGSRRTRRKSRPDRAQWSSTIIPGGGTFFTEGKDTQGPSFGNYDLGAGVDGQLQPFRRRRRRGQRRDRHRAGSGGSADRPSNLKTPNLLNYSGNLVISAANHSSVDAARHRRRRRPQSVRASRASASSAPTRSSPATSAAGVKWFAGRWGLRGDYRFIAVQSKRRRAGVLRAGNAIRPPHLRRSRRQRRAVIEMTWGGLHGRPTTGRKEAMAKRMIAMLAATLAIVAALGLREVQADSNRDRPGGGVSSRRLRR